MPLLKAKPLAVIILAYMKYLRNDIAQILRVSGNGKNYGDEWITVQGHSWLRG
jgi:hypothetical protein